MFLWHALINGRQQDLAQFLGSQGSTPHKTRKKREDKGEFNTDSPVKRRKGVEEPEHPKQTQEDKYLSSRIELVHAGTITIN